MLWLYILLGLVILFVVLEAATAVFFFGFAIKRHPFSPEKRQRENPDLDMSTEYELWEKGKEGLADHSFDTCELVSRDGLTLKARYYHAASPRGITVVMMHGYNMNWFHQFCFDALFYLSRGCDVLLPDQRACGESEGEYLTFGIRESEDCADWCRKVNELYSPEYIILHGISLGGATVLMATGEDLPENVRGVIEDCGFTSPYEQFKHNLKTMYKWLPPILVLPVTGLYCKVQAKFGFKDKDSSEIIKNCRIPLLVIHGGSDDFVPTRMGREIYEAAVCDKELLIIEGAEHAFAYRDEREKCEQAAARLIKKATGTDITAS